MAVGGAALLVPICAPYLAIYGPHKTDYMRLSFAFGYDLADLPWRLQVLVASPRGWFNEGDGIMQLLPWLPFGVAAMLYVAWQSVAERRLVGLALVGATTLYAVMMLAYHDLLPRNMWRFNLIHHFKWLFPAYALAGAVMVRRAWTEPRALFALVPVIGLTFLHLTPERVGDRGAARLLVFTAPPAAAPDQIYFAPSVIVDWRGILRQIFDFHQSLDGRTVRILSTERTFAGDERWIGNGESIPGWPAIHHPDEGKPLSGSWPQPPSPASPSG